MKLLLRILAPWVLFATFASGSWSQDTQSDPECSDCRNDSVQGSEALNPEIRAVLEGIELQIVDVETRFGPYHPEIGNLAFSRGLALQQLGLAREANEAFRQAIHVRRVNDGLYSLSQAEIHEALIANHAAAGDWHSVDNGYQALGWIYDQEFAGATKERLDFLMRRGEWQLYLVDSFFGHRTLRIDTSVRLLEGTEHLIEALQIADTLGLYIPEIGSSLAYAHYHLVRYASLIRRECSTRSSFDVEFSQSTSSSNCTASERANVYVLNSARRGTQLLEQNFELAQREGDITAQRHATELLADWRLLLNDRQQATELYRKVWALAEQEGPQAQSQYSNPQPIPSLHIANAFDPVIPEDPTTVIPMAINITRYGDVTRLNLLDSEAADTFPRAARSAAIIGRYMNFRPAIENGNLQETDNYLLEVEVYQ